MVAETFPLLLVESTTLFKVTVTYAAFGTPVRFTMY